MNPTQLTEALKQESQRLGFALHGACAAVATPRIESFRQWLAAGNAGEMRYLSDRAKAYRHPSHVLDGVRSLLMLGLPYHTIEPNDTRPGEGRLSRYAWGADYHDVVHQRLDRLADFHRQLTPDAKVRGVVDTAPLLEREFARLAGLGWIGKNTLLVNRRWGSWFFLAALLTTSELVPDKPFAANHCGTCRACLDACPTGALTCDHQLDARRCLSYLTIEQRGVIPRDHRARIGSWLFGCDVCQDVCPWNRRAETTTEASFHPTLGHNPIDLLGLFELDEVTYRERFRGTPLWRAKRRGLLSNAAIVLGNHPTPHGIPVLVRGLEDSEPSVRIACAWALGRMGPIGGTEGERALAARYEQESDEVVRHEIEDALTTQRTKKLDDPAHKKA